jgi:hypothetical protein
LTSTPCIPCWPCHPHDAQDPAHSHDNGGGEEEDELEDLESGGEEEELDEQYNGFNLGPLPTHAGITPRKDETAIDYIPDGTGRDTYIM